MTRINRQVAVTASVLLAVVLTVGALVAGAEGVAQAHGGGIEAEVRGVGTASQVTCSRNAFSLWTNWVCQADQIQWETHAPVPTRVIAQKTPYTVLATNNLTGAEIRVTSHLPMGWQTAGDARGRSSPPREIILAQDHPVGSQGWWTAQVFIPPVLVVTTVAAVAIVLMAQRRRRRR